MQPLLAKMRIDHDGMTGNLAAVERVLALVPASLRAARCGCQPDLTGALVAAVGGKRRGVWAPAKHLPSAGEAQAQARQIATRSALPELLLACAVRGMAQALREYDLPRAGRVFVRIEQLRPHVRPALLPRGLRAQPAGNCAVASLPPSSSAPG